MAQKSKVMVPKAFLLASQQLKIIQTAPTSSGKTFLLKHYAGERLARWQAVAAKCCDCMGFYIDGRIDCQVPGCPLYLFMAYRGKK